MDLWSEVIEMARFTRVRLGGEASWWLHQTSEERLCCRHLYLDTMS